MLKYVSWLLNFFRAMFFVFILTSVAGCADTRKALSLSKDSPDEFAIVRKKPLIIPPNFNLRPPNSSTDRLNLTSASQDARSVLIGTKKEKKLLNKNKADGSQGEQAFLNRTGVKSANPNIRAILVTENSQLAAYSNSFIDRLVSQVIRKRDGGEVVDPSREQKRIQEQQSTGVVGIQSQQNVLIRRKNNPTVRNSF